MQKFIKENTLEKTLSTKYLDVVKGPLPKNHFDYIYLHGIVQHFSDVGAGLVNCIEALKPNGLIWLYFYRSGSFPQFILYMIRDLIRDSKNINEYYVNTNLSSSNRYDKSLFVSDLMGDFFDTYIHLYTPSTYISFIRNCGLEVISSSKLDPFGKNVDHKFAHPSVVLVCKKTTSVDLTLINTELLSPSNSVNQLDEANYTINNEDILKSISLYQNLKQMIMAKKIPSSIVMSIAFRLYDFNYTSLINYKKTGSFNGHGDLQKILTDTIHLLNEEFP